MIGRTSVDQPHMYDALRHARAELEMAVPDKGSHRVFAIEATGRAIRETRAGIDCTR
jgi:hypothetical protein